MRAIVAAACACALAVSACTTAEPDDSASPSNSGDISMVTVVQSDSLAPDIEVQPGLDYFEEQTKVLWEGEGVELQDGQPLLLDIYGESLIDGTVLINTFDGLPESFLMAPEIIGEGMYEALRNVREGARVLVVSPPGEGEDEHEPVALVVDVLPYHAEGVAQQPVEGMPSVTEGPEGQPVVQVDPEREASPELEVATVIYGGGTQVRPTSHVLVNYVIVHHDDRPDDGGDGIDGAEQWQAGDVFDTSWDIEREPLLLDMDQVSAVPGLQQGLMDQTSGSRVLMVVPPELGYPERGTMIMVVDILDVWNPEIP